MSKAGSQGQRFSVLLNRLFGLTDAYLPIDVVPETLPTFDVGRDRFEYRLPRDETSWSCRVARALDAANFSFVGITNPVGSGQFIVIEEVQTEVAQLLFYSLRRGAPPAATANLASQDGRTQTNNAGVFVFAGVEAAAVQTDASVNLAIGIPQRCDACLPPGTAFFWEGIAINTAVQALSVRGYIRTCRTDEMAL